MDEPTRMDYKTYRNYSNINSIEFRKKDYWKELETISPKYASGIDIPICDADVEVLNLDKMDSILQDLLEMLDKKPIGVYSPTRYGFT